MTRGADDTIRIWDRAQQRDEVTIPHLRSQVAFSKAGVLAAVNGNSIRLFDASGNAIGSLEMQGYPGDTSIAFSHDGQRLAAGNADGYTRIWRAPGWELSRDLPRNKAVRVMRFCPRSNALVIVDAEGGVSLWDTVTAEQLPFPASTVDVHDAAFSPDGETLALIDASSVRLARWKTQTLLPLPEAGGGDRLCCSPDGKWLITSRGRDIFRHNLATGEVSSSWAQGRDIKSITFSPDGRRLITATSGGDGCVQLWDVDSLTVVATYAGGSSSFLSIDMAPDQCRLAAIRVCNGLSEAVIWEAAAPLESAEKR
jgi:dipeptidyl aminopeptidase/acylaminoacyl peptidase